ncbi:MAG: hypothetical protein CV089_20245 [Nitrospira sp. WS110]|nr:hypothetical protein [Nitrospira sp. WS110]
MKGLQDTKRTRGTDMTTRGNPAGYLRRQVDSLQLYREVRRCIRRKHPDFALLPRWRQRRIRGGIISSLVQGLHGNSGWGLSLLQRQRALKRWHPERKMHG